MTGALPLLCTSGAVLWVALAASAGLAPPVWRVRLFWAAVMLGVPGVGLVLLGDPALFGRFVDWAGRR